MTYVPTDLQTPLRPLRLWPGIAAAVLLVILKFAVPVVLPEAAMVAVIGSLACALAILLWWAFFSRAPKVERWGFLLLALLAMLITSRFLHKSIATGTMGMLFPLFGTPVLCLALAVCAVATARFSAAPRRALMVITILLASGAWTLLRTDGLKGSGSEFAWRWTPTHEEKLLAHVVREPTPLPPSTPAKTPAPTEQPATPALAAVSLRTPREEATPTAVAAVWPGFRGPSRDSRISGVRIATDWAASPPVEMWRRPIGPGWSSFAIDGDRIYTQEQRGEDEIVACYQASTGNPVWTHRDPARFWESNGGAGPRGTPTLSNGLVYTFGATGIVNALDARDGAVVWTRNAGTDADRKVPGWGFSSSPLVVDGLVVVAATGRLVAYDAATGAQRWLGPVGGGSYSSPHLFTIAGVKQVVLLNGSGAVSVLPSTGEVLWQHPWNVGGTPIVQPALAAEGEILITAVDMSGSVGTRRIAAEHASTGWNVTERWTSRNLKPYFNDFVVHNGHAFGFDGSILACIDLKDGTRKWKGGRYGNGQLVLLRDQNLLLVLSEEGELALVGAEADQFKELARFPAIEGKTWNHPVLNGSMLLVRNGQEMAAFRLATAPR